MAVALVVVTKEIDGEEWSNTHCVGQSDIIGRASGKPTEADMDGFGANTAVTASGLVAATASIVRSILEFERLIHPTAAIFRRVYIHDGERPTVEANPMYAVRELSFTGANDMGAAGVGGIMPGNVTLQVNRVPVGYSARKGRLFLRAVLSDTYVRIGGKSLITWTDTASKTAITNFINTQVTASGLASYLFGGANAATANYLIPHYRSLRDLTAEVPLGGLLWGTAVQSLVVASPVARQVKRGRKEEA